MIDMGRAGESGHDYFVQVHACVLLFLRKYSYSRKEQ